MAGRTRMAPRPDEIHGLLPAQRRHGKYPDGRWDARHRTTVRRGVFGQLRVRPAGPPHDTLLPRGTAGAVRPEDVRRQARRSRVSDAAPRTAGRGDRAYNRDAVRVVICARHRLGRPNSRDVWPGGFTQELCHGILRARYRDGYETPSLLRPGDVYEYTITVNPVSNLFLPDHRIRVDITSSDFPNFDRNHNTGGNDYFESALQSARQTILHDAAHPSRITLPRDPQIAGHPGVYWNPFHLVVPADGTLGVGYPEVSFKRTIRRGSVNHRVFARTKRMSQLYETGAPGPSHWRSDGFRQ